MKIRHDLLVRETVWEDVLANGLSVHLLPKPGFAKTEVALTVGFGAVDREVLLTNETVPTRFPEGTAHFLEHMLFESESDNLSNRFSACGASVNAYTAPTRTSYYFSTTNGIEAPLGLLMNLVFFPKFTEEQVDKERKIIANEIQMYQDDLDQMIYQDTMGALFSDHPVSADIAGTLDSILHINASVLQLAYDTFYHPAHFHLMVVGDIDPAKILEILRGTALVHINRPDRLAQRLGHREDPIAHRRLVTKKRDVKTDMLMIGVKLDKTVPTTPMANDLNEIRLAFLLENVLGKTSKLYRDLMDKRLINDTFEFSVSDETDYGFILLYTETKKPQATKKALLDYLRRIPELFVDEPRFEIAKKKMLGNFIQTFDHISSLCQFLTEYYVAGVDLFDLLRQVNEITFADLHDHAPYFSDAAITAVHYHP